MRVMFRGGSHDGEIIDVDDSLPDYWDVAEHIIPRIAEYDNLSAHIDKLTVETYKRKDFYNRGKYTYSEYCEVKL